MGPPESPAALARYPVLHQQEQPGPSVWTLRNDAGEEEAIEVLPRLATGDFGLLVEAARAGIGIALLPRGNCSAELATGQMVQVLAPWGAPDGLVHLVFTSRRGMLPGVARGGRFRRGSAPHGHELTRRSGAVLPGRTRRLVQAI